MKSILSILWSVLSVIPIRDYFLELKPWTLMHLDAHKHHPVPDRPEYYKLTQAELEARLREEHDRALVIDKKTSQTVFVVGILASFVNFIILYWKKDELMETISGMLIGGLSFYSAVYILFAAFIAGESLRSVTMYGLGTTFMVEKLEKGKMVVVDSLVKMEFWTNEAKYQHNEIAYECLRNCVISIGLIMGVLLVEFLIPFMFQFASYVAGKLGALWDFWGVGRYFCL